MEKELSPLLKTSFEVGVKGGPCPQPASCPPAPHPLQLLCRSSSLGSPSNLCGSPPGPGRKPPNLEGLVFPGEAGLAPSSYKKAPGFEREDQVGAEYLKTFKCQVRVKWGDRRYFKPSELSLFLPELREIWRRGLAPLWGGCLGGRILCLSLFRAGKGE